MTASASPAVVASPLLEALEERAAAEGKTVDEVANEAIKTGLAEQSWAAFAAKAAPTEPRPAWSLRTWRGFAKTFVPDGESGHR